MRRAPQVVLVTGASSGIGEAVVRQAASRGDDVVLVARGQESLDRVARDCEQLGAASTLVLSADVSDDGQAARVVTATMAEHGRIDIVVGCAGVVAYGTLEEVPVEVFDQVIATNLTGSVNLARHVLPVLREQRRGTLTFVGSLIGHLAVPDMAAYVLSKWGVRALVRQLRVDNRDRPGVGFGYVAPGGVDTPIYRQAATYGDAVGRPPFPVTSPERIASRVLATAEHPWRGGQVGLANQVIRAGFTALPFVYDRLVGPLFKVVAQDLTASFVRGPGNVLDSRQGGNRLHGGHGNALLGAMNNLAHLARADRAARLSGSSRSSRTPRPRAGALR